MTYKQNDVFLNAEDCEKIAPYIPKGMLEGWEWWYSQSGKLCFLEWFGANNGYIDGTRGRLHHVNSSYFEKFPKQYQVPALDTGILGQILDEVLSKPPFYQDPECISITVNVVSVMIAKQSKSVFAEPGDSIWEHCEQFTSNSELQNRRDAIMYLIDNGLIEEGKTNA